MQANDRSEPSLTHFQANGPVTLHLGLCWGDARSRPRPMTAKTQGLLFTAKDEKRGTPLPLLLHARPRGRDYLEAFALSPNWREKQVEASCRVRRLSERRFRSRSRVLISKILGPPGPRSSSSMKFLSMIMQVLRGILLSLLKLAFMIISPWAYISHK